MTKEEYFAFHQACLDKMTTITRAKNADYTGSGDDPFANFARVEAMGVCSVEQGFLTRMLDKFCRLSSFVQKGVLEVKDESVEDTLLDLANYCILLAGYIKSRRSEAKTIDLSFDVVAFDKLLTEAFDAIEKPEKKPKKQKKDSASTRAANSRAP